MLKETTRYENNDKTEDKGHNSLGSSRLPAVEELASGLKQKLHLKARARATPYFRQQEPVDLVERLLEERALVAEAVRRLQALQAQQSE